MSFLITGLASLLGASLAAIFTHIFTVNRKRKDDLTELKHKAYIDFLLAISKLVSARRKGETKDNVQDLASLNDAKTRICLFAEPDIVRTMHEFWDKGGTLEIEPEIIAFTRFCSEIRASLGYKRGDLYLNGVELSNLLFKLEPSKFSFATRNDSASAS